MSCRLRVYLSDNNTFDKEFELIKRAEEKKDEYLKVGYAEETANLRIFYPPHSIQKIELSTFKRR